MNMRKSNWIEFLNLGRNFQRQLRKFVTDPNENYDWAHDPVEHVEDADVIISLDKSKQGYHYPVLDIDIPHQYYPSTTEGHGHIYFDIPMTWDKYVPLLEALADAGIIQQGYVDACISRGYTSVRLPWVKKNG